jgi:hypothetical protein
VDAEAKGRATGKVLGSKDEVHVPVDSAGFLPRAVILVDSPRPAEASPTSQSVCRLSFQPIVM